MPPAGFCAINGPIVVMPFAPEVGSCGIVWIGLTDDEVDTIVTARNEDPRTDPGPAIAFTATPGGGLWTIDFNAG